MKPRTRQKNSLSERIKITQWDIQQPYRSYDLGPIHSINIDNDKKFTQLKIIINEYNQEVNEKQEANSRQGIIHGGMRRNFVDQLYIMLNDIAQTKDQDTQKRYLDDVYQWAQNYQFTNKSRPSTGNSKLFNTLTSFTRPGTGATAGNMRQKLLDLKGQQMKKVYNNPNRNQKQKIFENLMTQQLKKRNSIQKQRVNTQSSQMKQISQERRDYRMLHRTIHPLLKVPDERLKQFPRRKRLDIQIQKTVFVPSVVKVQKQKVQVPLDDDYYYDDDYLDQPVQEVPKVQQPPPQPPVPQVEDIPEIDFGGQPEQDAEPEQYQQQQILDKLAPKTKVYKDLYIPINDDTIKVTNNRNFKQKNNELKNVIMDIQASKFMQNHWSRIKGRWTSQTSRKHQSIKIKEKSSTLLMRQNMTQNIQDLTYLCQRPAIKSVQSSRLSGVEKQANSFRLKNIIKKQIKDIQLSNIQGMGNLGDKSNKVRSLSAHVSPSYRKRQFSQILAEGRSKLLEELDSQLVGLKQRLAGSRVPLEFTKLMTGIQVGQRETNNTYQDGQFGSINGRSLLNNPFFKVGKKKKKKKKKK